MTTQNPTRQNDFAGEMGRKYKEAMAILCPDQKRAERLLKKRIKEQREMYSDETLLDLGCGGGEFLYSLGNFPRNRAWTIDDTYEKLHMTGVDISPVMVEKAQGLLVGAIENSLVRIVQADIKEYLQAMNLTGQTADIITSNFVLHNFMDYERQEIFPQIFQALSAGGILLMDDKIARTSTQEHERDLAKQERVIESLAEHGMPELVRPWLAHYEADNYFRRRMVEGDLHNILRKVGFREVRTLYREKMEAIVEARK